MPFVPLSGNSSNSHSDKSTASPQPVQVDPSFDCSLGVGAVAAQIQFWKIIRRLNVAIEVPMNAADIGNIAAKPAKPTAT